LGTDDFYLLDKLKSTLTLVYWKDKPTVIGNDEIDAIKEFVDHHQNIKLEKSKVGFSNSLFTNDLTYTVNRNSVSVQTNLIRVPLPSIGFVMIAETERENIFEKDRSLFPVSTNLTPQHQ
jgi:hypothetical protein